MMVKCRKCNTYLPKEEVDNQNGLCATCRTKELIENLRGENDNGNNNK
jgi:Zn finger protein HypA/HybF involved in hydrogenase expression